MPGLPLATSLRVAQHALLSIYLLIAIRSPFVMPDHHGAERRSQPQKNSRKKQSRRILLNAVRRKRSSRRLVQEREREISHAAGWHLIEDLSECNITQSQRGTSFLMTQEVGSLRT